MTQTTKTPRTAAGSPAGAQPAIRFRGAAKSFGPVHAVAGIDLDVRRGETVALIGRNGAGKSTAISLLLGLNEPDAGTVHLFGRTFWESMRGYARRGNTVLFSTHYPAASGSRSGCSPSGGAPCPSSPRPAASPRSAGPSPPAPPPASPPWSSRCGPCCSARTRSFRTVGPRGRCRSWNGEAE